MHKVRLLACGRTTTPVGASGRWSAHQMSSGLHRPRYLGLRSVTWGAGRFVAVGYDGVIVHSSDGIHWKEAAQHVSGEFLRGVTWGDERFVAVGFEGIVVFSSDGDRWRRANKATPNELHGVAWSGEVFAAVGENGTIIVSP